jgi:anti-sigma factor RsiW
MNLHASTEQLSAYLDSELGFAVARQVESHCSGCAECATRLESMRRVVCGLGRAGRAVPPPALRQQIRRQVVAEPPVYGVRKLLDTLRFFLFPLQPGLRTAAAMGLALVVGLFTFAHEEGSFQRAAERAAAQPGEEKVTVEPGDHGVLVPTTSKVAGRDFTLTDDGWVQMGLDGQEPVARVDTGSPQGRALLTKLSGLEFLLADGTPVVLRYNLETVEIRNAPPTRVLGYEGPPAVHPIPRVRRGHPGRTVAA